jgi:hypothetical protein
VPPAALAPAELGGGREAVHDRHHHVADKYIDPLAEQEVERLAPVLGRVLTAGRRAGPMVEEGLGAAI